MSNMEKKTAEEIIKKHSPFGTMLCSNPKMIEAMEEYAQQSQASEGQHGAIHNMGYINENYNKPTTGQPNGFTKDQMFDAIASARKNTSFSAHEIILKLSTNLIKPTTLNGDELLTWLETLLSAQSKLGASDEVIRAYLSMQTKILSMMGK